VGRSQYVHVNADLHGGDLPGAGRNGHMLVLVGRVSTMDVGNPAKTYLSRWAEMITTSSGEVVPLMLVI
jgi:hypothetical protein